MRPTAWIVTAALVSSVACGSVNSPQGGGGGAGPVGQVRVGNIYFRSAHNGSENTAVDTIAAGGSVTWIWDAQGSHSIQSTGTPGIFRNSVVMDARNSTYTVILKNPGTYTYQCAVHGAAMTGVIVVQ